MHDKKLISFLKIQALMIPYWMVFAVCVVNMWRSQGESSLLGETLLALSITGALYVFVPLFKQGGDWLHALLAMPTSEDLVYPIQSAVFSHMVYFVYMISEAPPPPFMTLSLPFGLALLALVLLVMDKWTERTNAQGESTP